MSDVLLEVRDLRVDLPSDDGPVRAVAGVTFAVRRGRTLGVVGESGSGKTVSALAVLRLLGRGARVSGEIRFGGRDLLAASEADMRRVRGAGIAMVFQDPATALHPMLRVGDQVAEAVRAHRRVSRREAGAAAVAALRRVGMPDPEVRARQYPHELSGGMRQRAMIAAALAPGPEVLIADEPTTALDVSVQAQILDLLDTERHRTGMGMLFVSHSLATVSAVADDVLVMYAGRAVECGPRETVFAGPGHPYTRGLVAAVPRLTGPAGRLQPIPGAPASARTAPPGCAFHPRCGIAVDACRTHRPLLAGADHAVACHLYDPVPGVAAPTEDVA